METSWDIFCEEIPWQATIPSVTLNLRDKLLVGIQAPEIFHQRSSVGLTTGATWMIYVMFAFILLAVLGSSITACEFFFKGHRKTKCRDKEDITKRTTMFKNGKKSISILENYKRFLKSFCMIKNGSKILSTSSTEDQIDFIQGLRFVGNAWVILIHTGVAYIITLRDLKEAKPLLELKASQLLLNGLFSVDIFFVISGFLNAYRFSRKYSRYNGNRFWILFYFKRFLRLTPVYMIVLGFYSTLFSYSGMGLIWPTFDTNPVCKEDWWRHLFYINNFEESKKECLVWCWYLAADMQLYVISPLFMILLIRWPRFGYVLVFTCIGGSCVSSFMLTYQFHLVDGVSRLAFHLDNIRYFLMKFWKYFDIAYSKPYVRIGQYLIGLTLGHYLSKNNIKKNAIRNNRVTLVFGWIVTACFMWICFFSYNKREDILMETALYNGIKFLFFPCGIAWIIYTCLTGQAEFLNRCLSWKPLLPLGRLSYCAYLIHMIIILRLFLQAEDVNDSSPMTLLSFYLYICACTYSVSFMASVLFEIPVQNLLNWLVEKNGVKSSSVTYSDCKTYNQIHSDIYKMS